MVLNFDEYRRPNRKPSDVEKAVGKLAADTLDAQDDTSALSDQALGERLLSGKWSTVDVHEAGRRLRGR